MRAPVINWKMRGSMLQADLERGGAMPPCWSSIDRNCSTSLHIDLEGVSGGSASLQYNVVQRNGEGTCDEFHASWTKPL
jgi:hypothetical protein